MQMRDDSLLGSVDARTNLAGSNKMEILLFSIGTGERFGINVFKIKEVCRAMSLTRTPNMPQGVDGIVSLRGHVLPVLNLARFMGVNAPPESQRAMMVAEYSKHILGFLVHEVDRIIRVDWDRVRATDDMLTSKGGLVNALTELEDGSLVSLMDVEQILVSAFGEDAIGEVQKLEDGHELCVFFVDDSSVARRKIAEVLDKMGVRQMQANNGREAWDRLKVMAESTQAAGVRLHDQIQAILVDAEMPEMDGYVLTQHIKSDHRFDGIPVVMHSSLSSDANRAMGRRVGVDYYVPKFDGLALSDTLRPLLAA
ncbi:MAG: chemotaxis protein [Gallionella sp.]|jgi:two-component system chemotaxis response regulator CheV|nr:chemotaxis protein [Gallionella sp.]MCK9353640.1 chemotaxis protein [Gallionella sp.]